MGNAPSESNMGSSLRCTKCYKVLPACTSFSDYKQEIVNNQNVYVFNGGEYYRPVGHHNAYICRYCFYKQYEEAQRRMEEERRRREEAERRRREEEEKRRREEEERKRREEERKMKEQQRAEEQRRQEQLNQRLEESHQQAQEQYEKQLNSNISEEHESKRQVLISHLDEFEANYESDSDSDKLLENLLSKCSITIPNLSLDQLSSDQLESILSALDELLFDEWISTPPSLGTLQHTQVFITELCALSLDSSEGLSLQSLCDNVQSLVESISQSACSASETYLLTQALYLNLMHFFSDHDDSDNDAVLIAKRWAQEDLSREDRFLIEFLGTLTLSLQNVIGTVFILKMEIQCLKLVLFTLTHLNDVESHSESTEMLLRLVQTNQWTPAETLTLLQALSEKYVEDSSIAEVLTLVHVYDLSPDWTDDSGQSLIQNLEFMDPKRFPLDLQKTLRKQDEARLDYAIAELKTSENLDDSVIGTIKSIVTSILLYSENPLKDEPFIKEPFECASLNAEDILNSLCKLCKAVFDTKGWWPTVRQMLRWCVLVLSRAGGKSSMPELFTAEEEPCVTAMFTAALICMGNKLGIVLSSDVHSHNVSLKEWSDFYKYLGISVNTNLKTYARLRDVYQSDIVYGTVDDFISDYFQYGIEVMEVREPHLTRQYIIEEKSLSASHNLELSRLKENDKLAFVAEILQSLMGHFHSEDKELRHRFLKALFHVLQIQPTKDADAKIISISKNLTGKELPTNKVFMLSFLENLLEVVTNEMGTEKKFSSPVGRWCLEVLFTWAVQLQASKDKVGDLTQMVLNLVTQKLWSPGDVLNLLVTLTNHYHEDCNSIMKILHLMETYQLSSRDESKLSQVLGSLESGNPIEHLQKNFSEEEGKNINTLFKELRQMENSDSEILEKSHTIVNYVIDLIISGEIDTHKVLPSQTLGHSPDTEELQEILAVLCNAVRICKFKGEWWPRVTQMISWCLLALSDTGKLLEMGTGEGKSCVIAMFAALRAFRGEKIDVVSSSSVLCERDAEEWAEFYSYFGITVDTNTNKKTDGERKECYQKDVVYGTIETFAADHLRQIFEMKDVRPNRGFQCIVIDEVDSLLLDQGVQLTYLSSPMVSMQHLNSILAIIWSHVSQYGFLSTGLHTFVQSPPAPFFQAVFDAIDTEGTEINCPMDILCIAEESNVVPEGFTQDYYYTNNQADMKDCLLGKLKIVDQAALIDFFRAVEQYVPYVFTVYTLDDNGLLCLKKTSLYNNHDIPELTFLVLEEGLCCTLYSSEEILIKPIAELISEKIQYTPITGENVKEKISIPGFLKNLIEKKVSVWVQNAFLAIKLKQGREYVVENDSVCPVDFKSTGIIEVNKKWGDGLQQFVEMKHQVKLTTLSTVTNYVSNVSFFKKYQGKIYGTTGTLGSDTDMLFLQDLYPNLSASKMPSFNRKKLFEVKGIVKTSIQEWKSEIKQVIMTQISPNSYRGGRAVLVICETINRAKQIYEELQSLTSSDKIILYCRSDKDSLSKIDTELLPGHVIVATNLAGRGTDIKVSKEVNNHGGLFVILSFLSENTRVELQAFGRTARKGKPGSAQVIMTTEHLQDSFKTVSSLEEAKKARDRLAIEKVSHMMNDISEMNLREDLFSQYCRTLQAIYEATDGDEEKAIVAIMNEFWGIWLQTKSEEIDQLKSVELQNSLRADLSWAKNESQCQTSPCSSIYHYIKFGNIALEEKQWSVGTRLFEKAMNQDADWAAIAFYNHAYCTIMHRKDDYLIKAKENLRKAQESLKFLSEECMICLQFVKMSTTNFNQQTDNSIPTSLEKQFATKCNMISYFDDNISEAIKKLEEIEEKDSDAKAIKSPMFSLVSSSDEGLKEEAYSMYNQGLIYVFSVEEEPRFPWEALAVFFIGVLQIVAGALLTAFTFGTFAQIGMGLITEGISDCIYSVEAMVTREFSWKSWAIEKAISIGISLIGFGVGKLIAKGVSASAKAIKGFGRQLKSMPKFLSQQAKNSLSSVAKTNMRNAFSYTTKTVIDELVTYGLGKAEDAVLSEIMNCIKKNLKGKIVNDVKSQMENQHLDTLLDSIILSHLGDRGQLRDLLQDNKLQGIFIMLSNTALQPLYADLSWQNKLNSSISTVIDKVKSETGDKISIILTTIKVIHMTSLLTDATITVLSLSSSFFSEFHKVLSKFKTDKGLSERVKTNDLSASEMEILKQFKSDLANTISSLLSEALVDLFHQKFSGHLASYIQGKVNGFIGQHVRTGLKTGRTEEKLKAGQNASYIAHMPVNKNFKLAGESDKTSQSHAEKIKKTTTAGTILDIRVLSETLGIKVVIQTEDHKGKLTKMQELNPDNKTDSETVTLIYRPKSDQYPNGHYDVLINNRTEEVKSEHKNCLFHAFATGMKPGASEDEIKSEVKRLRSIEADALLRQPGQWEPFIKRKEWTETLRGGDWYMAEGAGQITVRKTIEKKILREHVGKVHPHKEQRKIAKNKQHFGTIINADHQPPVGCISQAIQLNQNSKLARAMHEVGISSPVDQNWISYVKEKHGPELLTVFVPTVIHRDFPSTVSREFRELLAKTISEDDVVGTFKLTFLGSLPRFMLDNSKEYKRFQSQRSRTRLTVFLESYPKHSKEITNEWFKHLKYLSNDEKQRYKEEIHTWIDEKKYDDQNDSLRKKVVRCLQTKKLVGQEY